MPTLTKALFAFMAMLASGSCVLLAAAGASYLSGPQRIEASVR